MGDKIQAKRILSSSDYGKDVPLIPDYRGDDQDDAALEREALRMGFPVLLKAAAGGGGRGMRIVRSAEGLREAISSAKAEGLSAFGGGEFVAAASTLSLSSLTVVQLRDRLREAGLPVSGRKAELVERLLRSVAEP